MSVEVVGLKKRAAYKELAFVIGAYHNCQKSGNEEWQERHLRRIEEIEERILPTGAGIDSGTTVDLNASSMDKIVLKSGYHAMNDCGMYDRWIAFTVTVRPHLVWEFTLTIRGPFGKYGFLKDYLADTFDEALRYESTFSQVAK